MRLLKYGSNGELSFTKNLIGDDEVPSYAILSHTWQDGQEVTFKEWKNGPSKEKAGYKKIIFCAQQAERDGLNHIWVDTCCINKSTNDELSTAINSMFRWYQNASKCYVYLPDVSVPDEITDARIFRVTWENAFRRSRWFTRGWTLQELLAPATVEFFSKDGKQLGTKISLEQDIHEITKIPISAIRGQRLSEFSIEERMGWSAKRTTTLKEDKVYCLLGIFGIFMPLIYGEGEEYATLRFNEEVEKRSKEALTENIAHRNVASPLSFPGVSQRDQPTLSKPSRSISSRNSLLRLDSSLRKLGFYASDISQKNESRAKSKRLIRLGVCPFELPWSIGYNTLELLIRATMQDSIRKLGYEFQIQHRVSPESPFMKACENGDIALMKRILEDKRGGINDQISSSGKTPLM